MTEQYPQTYSFGIYRTRRLAAFLGVKKISWQAPFISGWFSTKNISFIVGWGRKSNTEQARHNAQLLGKSYLTLEDGFLRSIGLGVSKSPPLSIVVDDLGIYYDATQPSRLENILNGDYQNIPDLPPFQSLNGALSATDQDPLDDDQLLCRATTCINQIITNKLSKYNDSPELNLGPKNRYRVLVVDQTAGDLSIQYGLAKAESFQAMLQAALDEHPEAEIIVKIHPDVIIGKKQGHLAACAGMERIRLVSDNINPIDLLQQVDEVYVVTSQLGFEALMLGKPVTCFGAPFYAGWGLTNDRIALPRRNRKRSIQQLFAAAYILYARYVNPETDSLCEIEQVVAHLTLQRQWFNNNCGTLYCIGFGIWKHGYARRYLHSPWNQIKFVRSARQIIHDQPGEDARLVVWGTRENSKTREVATRLNIPIWRMEDGFLRSIGLGSNLTAPASLVLDKTGVYFDPHQPSDLETILQQEQFSTTLLDRAEHLRKAIVTTGLSKYNFSQRKPLEHAATPGQRIILVPGQVEDDASIRLGCFDIKTNLDLLKSVRENNPNAYIIYKPHPDILSGNRKGGRKIDTQTSAYCDQVVTDIPIATCLQTYLPNGSRIIATHPMFGPDSYMKTEKELPMVMCNLSADQEIFDFWVEFFSSKSMRVESMSVDKHDELTAYSQGITHYVGRLFADLHLQPTRIDTLGYQMLLDVMGQTCNDSWQLFLDLQSYNPYAKKMRTSLQESIEKINEALASNGKSGK